MPGIDEGREANPRQVPRPTRGNVAIEMREDALREVVGLDRAGDGQLLQLRHEPPVAAYDASDQTFVAQMVQSTLFAVALASGIDKSKPARLTSALGVRVCAFEEARFECDSDILGKAYTNEASRRDGVARTHEADGVACRDGLAFRLGAQPFEALLSLVVHALAPLDRITTDTMLASASARQAIGTSPI